MLCIMSVGRKIKQIVHIEILHIMEVIMATPVIVFRNKWSRSTCVPQIAYKTCTLGNRMETASFQVWISNILQLHSLHVCVGHKLRQNAAEAHACEKLLSDILHSGGCYSALSFLFTQPDKPRSTKNYLNFIFQRKQTFSLFCISFWW